MALGPALRVADLSSSQQPQDQSIRMPTAWPTEAAMASTCASIIPMPVPAPRWARPKIPHPRAIRPESLSLEAED